MTTGYCNQVTHSLLSTNIPEFLNLQIHIRPAANLWTRVYITNYDECTKIHHGYGVDDDTLYRDCEVS